MFNFPGPDQFASNVQIHVFIHGTLYAVAAGSWKATGAAMAETDNRPNLKKSRTIFCLQLSIKVGLPHVKSLGAVTP